MTLTNGYRNGYWKKALKFGISTSLSIFFVNVLSPSSIIWAWEWWSHIFKIVGGVFLFNELLYFKNWLDNSNGSTSKDEQQIKDAKESLRLTP